MRKEGRASGLISSIIFYGTVFENGITGAAPDRTPVERGEYLKEIDTRVASGQGEALYDRAIGFFAVVECEGTMRVFLGTFDIDDTLFRAILAGSPNVLKSIPPIF